MGCFESKGHKIFDFKKKSFKNGNNGNLPPSLTEKDRVILVTSWQRLKTDVEKVGVVTFMKLFDSHPEVQDAFLPFQQLSKKDMEQSAILRSHALRVMGTVDKCISRLDTPDKFKDLMTNLGQRHLNYNVNEEFIEMVGQQFVYAIQPHLEDIWSDEVQVAWSQLFKYMTYYMRQGLRGSTTIQY